MAKGTKALINEAVDDSCLPELLFDFSVYLIMECYISRSEE